MRIVYAIILGMALVGCKDDEKKKDEKVGGEAGPNVDGDEPGAGGPVDGVAPVVQRSSQRGGNTGRGALSPDKAASRKAHEDKIAQLVIQKNQLTGEIANAQRALGGSARPAAATRPASPELIQAGEALIRAVIAASVEGGAIPPQPITPTAEDVAPFLEAVRAVSEATVPQGEARTRELTSALEGLKGVRPRLPTRGCDQAVDFLIDAVEREIGAGPDSSRLENPLLESIASVSGTAIPDSIAAAVATFQRERNLVNGQALVAAINAHKQTNEAQYDNGRPFEAMGEASRQLEGYYARPAQVRRHRATCETTLGRAVGVPTDRLYAAIRAYNEASGTASNRVALLQEIERLDGNRRAPVAAQYQDYMTLRRAGMSPEQAQASSALERLRTELAQVESQIAAEKAKI